MKKTGIFTLQEFITKEAVIYCREEEGLAELLLDISFAAKRIHAKVARAGLSGILGNTGCINVQGEEVKKLDEYANAVLMNALDQGAHCAGIASEELPGFIAFNGRNSIHSKYTCMFDPLDGSSNIDVNVSIGTIFGIYRRVTPAGSPAGLADFLCPGYNMVAAGYILYSSSTLLVFAGASGVNGFTLDPLRGEFCLSHPGIKCPADGNIYSVNHGNYFQFSSALQKYIACCQQSKTTAEQPCTLRYTGSLVSDVHRNLIKGGIFMYPAAPGMPLGKLRLMYECNPLAYIVEKAGGMAIDGRQRILGKKPTELHERSPFFIGSRKMVAALQEYYREVPDAY